MKISRQIRRSVRLAAGLALIAGLASCGGSSDNGGPTPPAASNTPPASASASVAGFIAFMKVLVATKDDTGSGLDLTGFVAPTSDNTEPDPSI